MENLFIPWPDEPDTMKGLSDNERLRLTICQVACYLSAFIIFLIVCALLTGCTTPRIVEEHHHHEYQADTLDVQAAVDSHMQSWHAEMQTEWLHILSEQCASWSSHEDQHETVTELITVSADSLGRTIRQEQRTVSRSLSRELQQQEQRLVREYEARLRVVVDSLDDIYQQRLEAVQARVAQLDTTLVKKTPVGDTRPWYSRFLDDAEWLALAVAIAIVALLILAKKLTWPLPSK